VRIRVAPSVRKPVWIAGFVVAVVATAGAVVIARSIPVSYAGVPGGGPGFGEAVARGDAADAQIHRTTAPATSGSGNARPACPECGVVQSTRRVESSAGHQVTVRHRDGSTSVFIETTPRTWRPGSRLILIPGVIAAGR
jgi:hypothetical protein